MIRAPVDQNPFYLWKFDGKKVFQEHLQFKWCPSPSNDKDIDTDCNWKRYSRYAHLRCLKWLWETRSFRINFLSGKTAELCRGVMWKVTGCFSRKPYAICGVMLHKWFWMSTTKFKATWVLAVCFQNKKYPTRVYWVCRHPTSKRSIQNYPIIQSFHSQYIKGTAKAWKCLVRYKSSSSKKYCNNEHLYS